MSTSDRSRLRKDVDEAQELQIKAGLKGAARSTVVGLGVIMIAHHSWPLFRRQTLAFKAFLVSGFTMFGLVVTADNVLLKHEANKRLLENALRKEARVDLARRGIVSTETAIRQWKEERRKAMESTPKTNHHESVV